MNYIKVIVFSSVAVLCSSVFLGAESARQIVKKAYNIDDGWDQKAVMDMEITLSNGFVRNRKLKYYRKDYGRNNRVLIEFLAPADVKGTKFLTWNYRNRDNSQWLYLPALKKTKRIPPSDKSSSFMGSDFSYEDISFRNINKDSFSLLGEESVSGSPCFKIEAKAKDNNETYSRRIFWIRKDNYIIVKAELYSEGPSPIKRLTTGEIKKINGIWTILESKMENLKKKTYTVLKLSEVKYNRGVSSRKFRKQGLKR